LEPARFHNQVLIIRTHSSQSKKPITGGDCV
jgi:hypothetical protein